MVSRNTDNRAAAAAEPAGGWFRVVLVAVYLAALAIAARLLTSVEDESDLPWYLILLVGYFALFSLVWLRPRMRPPILHVVFVVQCLLILCLLALEPEFDYVTSLFVPLAYQAALVFRGRVRWIWVVILVVLIGASLMIALGPVRGLGLGLTSMAVGLVFPALALASQEMEEARRESRKMVAELEATHRQLERYAGEVNDLAAVEERNRLARELHDSVSQAMFGVTLATRSAQIMLDRDPDGVRIQLERLQELTQDALARMRGFLAELRPKVQTEVEGGPAAEEATPAETPRQ